MAGKGYSNAAAPKKGANDGPILEVGRLAHLVSAEQHFVLLTRHNGIAPLWRQDDLLDDGVAAIFAFVDDKAELLALGFDATQFSAADVTAWLSERRFRPLLFVPSGGYAQSTPVNGNP